jgi:hypothetical protein
MIEDESLFKSVHEVLVFAFNYAGQQSPKTPLMSMVMNPGDQEGYIGSGKGLTGFDAAAQAGMILSEVCRLPDDQHNVIVARYYRVQHECKCCEQLRPMDEWKLAIDALSRCIELEGVHRAVRFAMVEKAICGERMDIAALCKRYSLSKQTAYRQISILKKKFIVIERQALAALNDVFYSDKQLVA